MICQAAALLIAEMRTSPVAPNRRALQGFPPGCVLVEVMNKIEFDAVGFQAGQSSFRWLGKHVVVSPPVIRARPDATLKLGADDPFVPAGFEEPANDLFSRSLAVDVCRINKIEAAIPAFLKNAFRRGFIGLLAEGRWCPDRALRPEGLSFRWIYISFPVGLRSDLRDKHTVVASVALASSAVEGVGQTWSASTLPRIPRFHFH